MTMLERVAQAIRDESVDRGHHVSPLVVMHLARAAIEAMREPHGPLMDAGGKLSFQEHEVLARLNAQAIWAAMINAALAEGDGG